MSTKKAPQEVIDLVRTSLDYEMKALDCKNYAELARKKGWRLARIYDWRAGRYLGPVEELGPVICRACHAHAQPQPVEPS